VHLRAATYGRTLPNRVQGGEIRHEYITACFCSRSPDGLPTSSISCGFSVTWNNHDMVAFGKLFTMDADFVNVGGLWWRGRKEIQMQHAWSHGAIPLETKGFDVADRAYYGIFKSSKMQFDRIDVRFLRKDVAVARVSWKLLGDARTPNPRIGLFMFVVTRQDSEWLIAAAQNTEIDRVAK